jgi:hypothetical protein
LEYLGKCLETEAKIPAGLIYGHTNPALVDKPKAIDSLIGAGM